MSWRGSGTPDWQMIIAGLLVLAMLAFAVFILVVGPMPPVD